MYPKFLYYIVKPDGRSGTVKNGVVTFTGVRTPLPYSPDGWQEIALAFTRSTDFHGLDQDLSLPLGFFLEDAKIIRDGLYKDGVQTDLELLIQRLILELDPVNYRWRYKFFYKGKLDMPKAVDDQDMISVPVSENAINKLFKANEKKVYEFAMSDPACVNLFHDGIIKEFEKKYAIEKNSEVTGTANYFLGMTGLPSEGESPNVAFFDVPFQVSTPYPNTKNFEAVAALDQVQTVSGYIDIYFNKSVSPLMRMETNNGGGFPQYELIPFATAEPAGSIKRYFFNRTDTIPAGDKLNMKMAGGSGSDPTTQYTVIGGEISIKYTYRAPGTYMRCYTRVGLHKKLAGKTVGDETKAIGEFCNTYDSVLITSSEAIRRLPDAVLKTSAIDFYEDNDSIAPAGRQVSADGIQINPREFYYTEDDLIDLGRVTERERKPALDFMFNTFQFGHQKQDIEDINGKYDPCGNTAYEGPLSETVKKYNAVSPYKAGPMEIESLRTQLQGQDSTDDRRDSGVFVIVAKPNPDIVGIDVTFDAALGGILIDLQDRFLEGQQIRISGSAGNDGIYDIDQLGNNGVSDFIKFVQSVTDEGPVSVTIEFLQGRIYTLDRDGYTITSGVPNDSWYNLKIVTPKNALKAHGRWIASMHYGQMNKQIKFLNGENNKNTDLITTLANEKSSETIATLGAPIFLPFEDSFKSEVILDPELFSENPNRGVKFTDEYGQEWKAFIRMIGIAPNDYTPQEYRVLLSASNDIIRSIH